MFQTVHNALKIPDLRRKIVYTLLMLLVYRIGGFVPIAGVNSAYIAQQVQNFSLLGFIDLLSGGNMEKFTIFAMGIQPYINASIIMQLLTVAIPKLEAMQKEGEDGRKKIAQITRYVTIVIGIIMAVGIILGLGPEAVTSASVWNYISIGLSMAAGTAFTMWLGERINENGIGNGISLIIFIGIISRIPTIVANAVGSLTVNFATIWQWPLWIAGLVLLVAAVVFVDQGERRIPVRYAQRVVGRRMLGGQSTHLPLKVNSTGVLPLIFASSILQFPGIIGQFIPNTGYAKWVDANLGSSGVLFVVLQFLLILFFTYFYMTITFNPIEIAKNLQQNGGFIPGIRPGHPTSEFIQRTTNRITLFGALFLSVLATIPTIILILTGNATPLGATSVLIVVSVALETTRQIESQMVMRHYEGFLRS